MILQHTSVRILLLSTSVCSALGALAGALSATSWVVQNRYWHFHAYWLMSEAYAERVIVGMGIGLAVGSVLALPVLLVVRRKSAAADEGLGALSVSLGLVASVCLVGVWLVHDQFARYPHWRFWAAVAPLAIGGLLGWVIIYRLLERREFLRRRSRACFRTVVAGALAVVGITGALNAFHYLARPSPADGTPSIFLITVDTQRPDHIGCYGYALDTTPKLDRLAESGRIYLNAFSHAPATGSSVASLLSGLRPRETGSYGQQRIRLETNTIAEYLKNAGYRTAAIVSNPVLRRGKNYDQGFDHFDDRMEDMELNRPVPQRIGPDTTEAALAWLQDKAGEPLFLWVHYMDPHGPYTPPEGYRALFVDDFPSGEMLEVTGSATGYGGIPSYQTLGAHREWGYYVSQYDAEVRFFDDALAELIAGLETRGLWDDALVLFTSDHGEGMGEHDYYFSHGENLYPSLLHVPLIIWGGAERRGAGEKVAAVVQQADLLPTVLSFARVAAPHPLPGRDLLAGVSEDALVLAENVIRGVYQCSLIAGETEVIYEGSDRNARFYDLRDPAAPPVLDPAGSEQHSALAKAAIDLCRRFVDVPSPDEGRMEPKELEILRSLGYID